MEEALTEDDAAIIAAMRAFGGAFTRALGAAAAVADAINLAKLKAAFPDYWADYQQFAAMEAARIKKESEA